MCYYPAELQKWSAEQPAAREEGAMVKCLAHNGEAQEQLPQLSALKENCEPNSQKKPNLSLLQESQVVVKSSAIKPGKSQALSLGVKPKAKSAAQQQEVLKLKHVVGFSGKCW